MIHVNRNLFKTECPEVCISYRELFEGLGEAAFWLYANTVFISLFPVLSATISESAVTSYSGVHVPTLQEMA